MTDEAKMTHVSYGYWDGPIIEGGKVVHPGTFVPYSKSKEAAMTNPTQDAIGRLRELVADLDANDHTTIVQFNGWSGTRHEAALHELKELGPSTARTLLTALDGDGVVERVAVECHHASCANVPHHRPNYRREAFPWDDLPENAKAAWRTIARAALNAVIGEL